MSAPDSRQAPQPRLPKKLDEGQRSDGQRFDECERVDEGPVGDPKLDKGINPQYSDEDLTRKSKENESLPEG